jgi:hypothetical protein
MGMNEEEEGNVLKMRYGDGVERSLLNLCCLRLKWLSWRRHPRRIKDQTLKLARSMKKFIFHIGWVHGAGSEMHRVRFS